MPVLSPFVAVRRADLHDPAERARIAAFVELHAEGTPFHLPEWSLAVAMGCGQKPHYLIAESAAGALAGLLPLTEIRHPIFGKALVSAGFAVGGGVLADNPAVVSALADEGWALAEKLGIASLDMRGGPIPGPEWQTDADTYLGFARDLASNDEAELLAIPRKQRAEVRKSLERDLTIDFGDRKAHYAVYAESVRNLGTPVFPRALFDAVLDLFGERADILTVRAAGKPVASVLSLYFNGTVYPYWGGGTEAARGLRANDRMYFALMSHARARGCTRFDFGRSKAGTGPAAFKKNWGFEGVPLAYPFRVAEGAERREVNPLNPRYALKIALWKRLPLGIANRVGPFLARGLG